jgi:hypothetical protein
VIGGLFTSSPASAAAPSPCPGNAIAPDQVISGSFSAAQEGDFVFLPVDVPAGQTSIRVKYCYDQPELPTNARIRHTLDVGLYQPLAQGDAIWAGPEFRGWSGSNISDFTVTPEGYSPVNGAGTTRGYLPGPIPTGRWAIELGLASVVGQNGGDIDGKVDWRVEVDWGADGADADEPYQPASYDSTPADPNAGWYSGDVHTHTSMSGDASSATFDKLLAFSFCPDPDLGSLCDSPAAKPGAGLDFINVNDHNNGAAWGELGRYQGDYPGHLALRSQEVTTYRGHTDADFNPHYVDYRTGPLYERQGDGSLTRVRAPTSPGEPGGIFDQVHAGGGFTQINHPTIFPSAVPSFSELCRGCPWDYSAAETDYSKVDSIEVSTGPAGLHQSPYPGPNPFTPLALRFYEDAIDAGGLNSNHIAAVGGSDNHSAGETGGPTDVTGAPIGEATTEVYAPELSEQGIEDGVKAGHTYVKLWGNNGPDVRLEAAVPGSSAPASIMGDTVHASRAKLTVKVLHLDRARAARPGEYTLFVYRNGEPLVGAAIPSGKDEFDYELTAAPSARYRLQVERTAGGADAIETVSSPLYLEPPEPGPPPPPGHCATLVGGTGGDDSFAGTPNSDFFRGLDGADRIRGRQGDDCLGGGPGPDRVTGGPGADRVQGGAGADRLSAADGEADRVRCGAGPQDRATVDASDSVKGCEIVRQR